MPKILYASGKEVYIEPEELNRMILKFQTSGVRMAKTKNGNILFLNSNTMDYLDVSDLKQNIIPPLSVVEEVVECSFTVEPQPVVETNPESAVQKEQRALDEIMQKSNCTHQGLLKYTVSAGVKGKRYAQQCSFCGWRSKFIKAETLTEAEREGAEQYNEK